MSTFTRKLILGERVMYADGMSPVNCVFTVSLRGDVSPEGLRIALDKVQAKHALLRARILSKRGRPYFQGGSVGADGRRVPGGAVGEIPVRVLDRKSDDDWQKVTEEEWALPFDVEKGPLARVVWLRAGFRSEVGGGAISELMLVCPHCICDGATGVTLMREILLLLDQPEDLIGDYPVFQSVKEIIPGSLLASKGGRIKAYLRSLGLRILFSLRPIRPAGVKGQPYVIRWQLDEGISGVLIERCKLEEVTVHAALCVIFLEAYREIKKGEARNKVICPVDIRRYVREIRKDMMFAFAPIVELGMAQTGGAAGGGVEGGAAGSDLGVGGTGFWERCRQLKGELAEKMATIKAYELLLFSEYYHPVAKKLIRWLCTDAGSHDFTFSNMGRLDIPEEYETFTVEAVHSPTVAFPWRNPTTVVVSSFRGQMDFAYVSNTGFLRYDEAVAIREKVRQALTDVVQADVLPVDLK